jgi:hypothetical protein
MTATSKNIESIVKQWTTFDLKTIQVKSSLFIPIQLISVLFVDPTHNLLSLFVKCPFLSFRVELVDQFSRKKRMN